MRILKRVKERFKKILASKKEISPKAGKGKAKAPAGPGEVLGAQETAEEKAKFSTPAPAKAAIHRIAEDLPAGYGEDKIVIQTRDPWWIHSYWEVTPSTLDRVKAQLGAKFFDARMVLRVYDVTHIIFDGANAHRFFDIEIACSANSWYINVSGPGRSWCVDLGLRLATGEFILICRSNTVSTPLDGPSWVSDEEWMIPDDMFARLYGMGFGLGRSSPVGKAWQERMKKALFSGILASPGITSVASPAKKIPKKRGFWLVVNTELIVYGATEPDAKVRVQGKQIKLRPDGTFSLRFALPDGKQVIPVNALSADHQEERTITPIVSKETR